MSDEIKSEEIEIIEILLNHFPVSAEEVDPSPILILSFLQFTHKGTGKEWN
jgi:hypothetical protein